MSWLRDPLVMVALKAMGGLAFIIVLVVGLLSLVNGGLGSNSGTQVAGIQPAGTSSKPKSEYNRSAIEKGLQRGVARAAKLGGSAEAAVMLDSWKSPVLAATSPSDVSRSSRMWSMSKVVTATAVLHGLGWADKRGRPIPDELNDALEGALVRSENCRQRRVVTILQDLQNGPEGATKAIQEVMKKAGAKARVATEVGTLDSTCDDYMSTQAEGSNASAPAVLLGTSTWRATDAARFMNALGSGIYGAAVEKKVVSLLQIPKEPSRESPPGDYTASLDWGAGRVFPELDPAYKAGWGGREDSAFMAGQIALVELPSGEKASIAVVFHPTTQPPIDDPGLTSAPQGVETVMESVASVLLRPSGSN